jgi:DNA-binding MarR family transcriptional regulator
MPSTDAIPSPIARLALEPPGTTADLIGLLTNLFFLPGDLLLWALAAHASFLAHSLGVGPSDYGGVLSGFISSCAWIAAFISVAIVCQAVVDFDRRMTAATKRLFAFATLRLRIARTLARQRIRAWLAARAPASPVELASDIEVSPEQLHVLRVHAKLPPGYALTVREAAEATGARLSTTQSLVDGLHKLGLLQPTFGGEDDERAYVLTKAGKALLAFSKIDDPRAPARPRTVRREPTM